MNLSKIDLSVKTIETTRGNNKPMAPLFTCRLLRVRTQIKAGKKGES
jgi:hypothetical protein